MLDRFRTFSKSKTGTGILAALGVAILASFALGDISSMKNGNFGLGSTTLAKVGGREVSDRDVTQGMEQVLQRARQQNAGATLPDVAGEFEPLLASLVQAQALSAFGDDNGFVLSKRLLDAQIAAIPGARGLDGRVSDASYQAFLDKQRLTDAEVRRLLSASVMQRLLLAPAAANARLSVGLAAPYATMLMEQREGELALVPVAPFASGLKPTPAQLAAFYAANKARYTVPEQRSLRIARFGAGEAAPAPPTDQEIAAYYKANQAAYAAKETRSISQAVVADPKVAAGIAARARAGGPFVAAVQPAGLGAQDIAVGPQTRAEFSDLASDKVAAAAFDGAVKVGSIIGPIQSDLGWHVIRVDSITGDPGKTLAAARPEIAAKLTADKRKTALSDLVNRVQDAIDGGQSFTEAVAKNRLSATETPLLTAQGGSISDPSFKLTPDLAGALKSGFELSGQDSPVIETLPGDAGFALVALGREVPASPAPLASIQARVANDWITQQAAARARTAASAIAARASAGASLAQAMAAAGVPLPAPRPVTARRIELEQAPPAIADAMRMLFSLTPGKSRMVAAPAAQGFAIVRVTKVVPGSALAQPTLIARLQSQFQTGASEEYARQFLAAVTAKVGVTRNETAIAAARQRLTATSAAE